MLDRESKVAMLNRALHHTVNSVLQYLEVSTPYVPQGYEERYAEALKIRDREIEIANLLVDRINGLDGVPSVGVFTYWNVDLNYLDFRFMARFSAKNLTDAVTQIEVDLKTARANRDNDLAGVLEGFAAEKRQFAEALAAIGAKAEPETAAADAGDE